MIFNQYWGTSPYERRRRVLCLRCANGWLTEQFPHECVYCEGHSSWIIGVPLSDPTFRKLLAALKRDKQRYGLAP